MSPLSVAVVVITRNRCADLLRTLGELGVLTASGEVSEIVVVDNASTDETVRAVRECFPDVVLLPQTRNLGAVGRTAGAQATSASLIAFADDDSWWEPGALARAAGLFARHPRLGLVHARIVVQPEGTDDDVCRMMARGPRSPGLPGPSILGHLACGSVVRRRTYLELGGYEPLLEFGGEERLLALDLATAGWAQCYVEDVVAHHQPSTIRDAWPQRWARYRRNDTMTAILRLPARTAAHEATQLVWQAARDRAVRAEMGPFVRRLPRLLSRRRRVPGRVLQELRVIAAVR